MLPNALGDRLDALIDDLIMDGGVEAASLASILLAAKDSLRSNYLVTLSRRVWSESNELKAGFGVETLGTDSGYGESTPAELNQDGSSASTCHPGEVPAA
ncbi:MAG: hypothetical protein U0794_21010 [Isosphaeraceae bacterium]